MEERINRIEQTIFTINLLATKGEGTSKQTEAKSFRRMAPSPDVAVKLLRGKVEEYQKRGFDVHISVGIQQ